MSQNGTPPQPANVTHFNEPANLVGFFVLDRAVADLNMTSSQLQAVGLSDTAALIHGLSIKMAELRDEIRKKDQASIIVAGALPRRPV